MEKTVRGSEACVWLQPARSCSADSYSDQLKFIAITKFIMQVRTTINRILRFFKFSSSVLSRIYPDEKKRKANVPELF